MSERSTPETDAEVIICHGIPDGFNPPERSYTSSKFARRLERERDEARAAIPDGEWVTHEDYQKIHDAASRLVDAIHKQLPIGCFILVNSEYHRLKNAIRGKEDAK